MISPDRRGPRVHERTDDTGKNRTHFSGHMTSQYLTIVYVATTERNSAVLPS